jgi:uncharacterized protein (TIGR00369 family)
MTEGFGNMGWKECTNLQAKIVLSPTDNREECAIMTDNLRRLDEAFAELTDGRVNTATHPPCFISMGGEFLDYESRTMLQAKFPVRAEYANPVGTMQGGFISAAMDNVLGPLSYVAARSACVTLDLSTQYVRGTDPGETLTVTARVISRSPSHLLMRAEAANDKGKLVATATSTALVIRRP